MVDGPEFPQPDSISGVKACVHYTFESLSSTCFTVACVLDFNLCFWKSRVNSRPPGPTSQKVLSTRVKKMVLFLLRSFFSGLCLEYLTSTRAVGK